jgi:CIC family chloride channel protein
MVVKQATWRQNVLRAQTARLVLVPSFLGALTGAAAIAFVKLIDLVQWLAIGSTQWPLHVLPYLAWYHVLLVPALGGLVVGPLVCKAAPEAEGHGVPEVIETVMARGGRMRSRVAVVKTLASAVTIGTGGSVGREGPVVQIGAAIGSGLGQLLRLPSEQLKTLAACGTAGGIAAIFNAPIAGAFFALEVITRDFAMRSFSPVILSSVLATVVSRAWFGDHPAFTVQPFELASALEMPLYAVLGLLCGTVGAWFVWTMDRFESWTAKLPVPKMWRPGLGGLVLGGMVLLLPNLYGVGYATMDAALSGALPLAPFGRAGADEDLGHEPDDRFRRFRRRVSPFPVHGRHGRRALRHGCPSPSARRFRSLRGVCADRHVRGSGRGHPFADHSDDPSH